MAFPTLPLLLAFALPLQAVEAKTSQLPRTLADLRDRYRPLLLFAAPYDQQGKLTDQVDSLKLHRADLIDRQVMLVPFFAAEGRMTDSAVESWLPGEEVTLRRRFHIRPDDFTVILIGKDGGEKFRSHTPVTIEQLNRIIDAMPMRQQETRSRLVP